MSFARLARQMGHAFDEDEAPVRDACRCGGDMPGRCPGPAFCPMCEPGPLTCECCGREGYDVEEVHGQPLCEDCADEKAEAQAAPECDQ